MYGVVIIKYPTKSLFHYFWSNIYYKYYKLYVFVKLLLLLLYYIVVLYYQYSTVIIGHIYWYTCPPTLLYVRAELFELVIIIKKRQRWNLFKVMLTLNVNLYGIKTQRHKHKNILNYNQWRTSYSFGVYILIFQKL